MREAGYAPENERIHGVEMSKNVGFVDMFPGKVLAISVWL